MTPDEPTRIIPYATKPDLKPYARRIKILGWLFVLLAVFSLVKIFVFTSGFSRSAATSLGTAPPEGSRAASQTPAERAAFYGAFGVAVQIPTILGAIAGLVAGFGLLARQPWGRTATLVLSVPLLIDLPFGTLLAVFALYLMVKRGSGERYAQLSASS
jgi:hypothetical protein